MKAIVVYESLWGNTSAVAHAIADGLGHPEAAMTTSAATTEVVADADLIVAGSPVFAFKMPSEDIRQSLRADHGQAPQPPDLSHKSMASWLKSLPAGSGYAASFDTQARGPFGSAAPQIMELLEDAGYRPLVTPGGFIVVGKYGPLQDGELERAREFGKEILVALNQLT